MSSWLQRQRKGDLLTLAENADLKNTDNMLKDELVAALETILETDAPRLSSNPVFSEYYGRRGSPMKKAATDDAGEPTAKEKRVRRRTTKVKDEIESPDDSTPAKTAVATRTPRQIKNAVARRVSITTSPQAMTDWVERKSSNMRTKAKTWYGQTGTTEFVEYMREFLSSVAGVELVSLLVEYNGLQRKTLPLRYAFSLPATPVTNTQAVFLPDFFNLATHDFWGPTAVWATTSIFLPLITAYFFNFRMQAKPAGSRGRNRASEIDPLTFNVSKALISWLVYAQGLRFAGLFADQTVEDVNATLWGGYGGVLIGSAIGTLSSLYDAVLRK